MTVSTGRAGAMGLGVLADRVTRPGVEAHEVAEIVEATTEGVLAPLALEVVRRDPRAEHTGRILVAAWLLASLGDWRPSPAEWVEAFRRVDYTVNGRPARRPRGPVRLWRGADAEHARGMSWSQRRAVAQVFARSDEWQVPHAEPGRVWRTVAEERAVLARITRPAAALWRPRDGSGVWDEVVIDPAMVGEVEEA